MKTKKEISIRYAEKEVDLKPLAKNIAEYFVQYYRQEAPK